MLIMNIKPRMAFVKPSGRFYIWFFNLVSNPKFDTFFMATIIAMTLSMMTTYAGESQTVKTIHEWLHMVFTGLFMVEAVAKLIAYKWQYFKSNWNMFDFLLVILSIVSYKTNYFLSGDFGQASSMVIRTLKVGRLIKLIQGMR